MNFKLKTLKHSEVLEKLILENNKRTIPIMKGIINEYLDTKEYNQQKWNEDFEKFGKKEIEQFMIEIEKILKKNTKILKGNFLPFIF